MASEDKVEISITDAISAFEENQSGFQESEDYYSGAARDLAVGIGTPPALRALLAQVGVPRIYIDAISERLIVEGFRLGDTSETDEDLWTWFRANRMKFQSQLAMREALIYGRSYLTIAAAGETAEDTEDPMQVEDVPIIKAESPKSLYADIDPRTGKVNWAIRVVRDSSGENVAATLYYTDRTEIYIAQDGELVLSDTVSHGLGVVPVVPLIHSDGLGDTTGTSAITPEIRSITDALSRTMMDMQTASALMATPQRAIFGSSMEELTGDREGLTPLELYTASYLIFDDPTGRIESLPAAELRNYTEAISEMLKLAAAYTGLPPQYLSYSDSNPASAEAIRSSETRLVRTCEALGEMFGDAFEQAMRIALLIQGTQLTLDHFQMETVWRDPSTPTYAAMADATQKLYANGSGIIPKEQARIDMGYTPEQRKQMEEWDKMDPAAQMASLYSGDPSAPDPDPEQEVTGETDGAGEPPIE